MEVKWIAIMFASFALAAAIFGIAFRVTQSQTAQACVGAGGSWTVVDDHHNMGCINKGDK